MFKYHQQVPTSLRYAQLDRDDETARAILRVSRRAASQKDRGRDNQLARSQLAKIMRPLDMGQLNTLAVMYMIVHPNVHAGATGQGGIWAMASEIVNEVARDLLKDRPAFEVVARYV